MALLSFAERQSPEIPKCRWKCRCRAGRTKRDPSGHDEFNCSAIGLWAGLFHLRSPVHPARHCVRVIIAPAQLPIVTHISRNKGHPLDREPGTDYRAIMTFGRAKKR